MSWTCTNCHRKMSVEHYDWAVAGVDDRGYYVLCQECWDAIPKFDELWRTVEPTPDKKHKPSFQELYEQHGTQLDDELLRTHFAPPRKPGFADGIRELAHRLTGPLCLSLLGWLILSGFVALVIR